MQIVSVNVGLPREVTWKGRTVTTGIFKEPVSERVIVRSLNLDGDAIANYIRQFLTSRVQLIPA